ncbi:MAG: tol-pal system protein YbgF [Ramlibacter sp.]|jgi:tol-pal system protein YbgF|nr:tol-pal system protein YbgF [Ramlibacter sp.]
MKGRALLLASLLALSAPAFAGLFDDEEARKAILDLRQKVEANRIAAEGADQRMGEELRRASDENVQMRRSMLDLQNQIETLRSELATSRGQQEQLARQLSEAQQRQKDLAVAVEERLRKFEPTKVTVDGQEFAADPAEKRDFEAALATFRRGEFAPAQAAFGDFLKRYPQSGYVPSALFWLGNAQYATRDYTGAIANFRALLTRAPDHVRAPEAVLSIANCQIELKDTRSARKTLDDLMKAYPQSEAATAARERLARLR